ncbi:hypothetical protein DFA_09124 [Cavenderia fasciculata]|uniref:SWIM-type domain-containing protein n=1 Tax=Cavenderia fasciculata TaxID=261658 RepID=F4Q6R7_CACFS|nr:uncharacterized protein DFA_09124 [Cavenderia fasciculata]EGG16577.1 hypothetical protein DFA_09124 [Cavenderia fasciculata]|eukprot:XP_004354977.1 hypothetical protein DFA_09124 [Cavenderia fasciculata]
MTDNNNNNQNILLNRIRFVNDNNNPTQQQQQQDDSTTNSHQTLNFVDGAPELVFLGGPPCSGKTYYYNQTFKDTHVRVSAESLFQDHSDMSFRNIIYNYVIKQLREGKNVVIDDMNHLHTVRQSYIMALLKDQTPLGTTMFLNFIPSGGETQLKWAEAWAFTERSLSNSYSVSKFSRMELSQFKSEYTKPTYKDGFKFVRDITIPLHMNLHKDARHALTNLGLFVDARSLFEFVDRTKTHRCGPALRFKYHVQLKQDVYKPIKEWVDLGPGMRRVILLIDEVSLFPASIDLTDSILTEQYQKEVKKSIKTLSDLVQFPIYYYIVPYNNARYNNDGVPVMPYQNDFYRFPNPGMIAAAQHRHKLSLHNSIVIVDDADTKSLSSLPLPVILSSKFFQQNSFEVETKLLKNKIENPTFNFLENILFVNYDDIRGYDSEESEKGLPLHSRINSESNELSFTEEYLPLDKRHGVFFPHADFHQSITDQQLLLIQPINNMDQQQQKPSDPIIPYVHPDLMIEYGIDRVSVGRGEGYYKECRVQNIETSIHSPDFSIPSTLVKAECRGTATYPYMLQIRYRQKGNILASPLMETHCSCPHGQRTFGKCKHIVSLLFYCNLNLAEQPSPQSSTPVSPPLSPVQGNNTGSSVPTSPFTPTKNRVLPDWMTVPVHQQQRDITKVSPNKRTLTMYQKNDDGIISPSRSHKKQLQFVSTIAAASSTSSIPTFTNLAETEQAIQQLFINSKLIDHPQKVDQQTASGSSSPNQNQNQNQNNNNNNSTPPDQDGMSTDQSGDSMDQQQEEEEEFVLPRTTSEQSVLSFIQNMGSQQNNNQQQPPTVNNNNNNNIQQQQQEEPKKKITLKELLVRHSIELPLPSPVKNTSSKSTVTSSQLHIDITSQTVNKSININ